MLEVVVEPITVRHGTCRFEEFGSFREGGNALKQHYAFFIVREHGKSIHAEPTRWCANAMLTKLSPDGRLTMSAFQPA